ncbi:hypothetical protein FNV43_RR25652 [Rhamnella rubrinervis]|uniref:protein-serine/threonine phosphatase n=1 Tax=Rhamnella rubrinervis TaxID=2594499 RepID=A0A8K0DH79_9ROSA|nr:hypothetical protein FNV43_RR25652 [Rhamnella rubrinervis]
MIIFGSDCVGCNKLEEIEEEEEEEEALSMIGKDESFVRVADDVEEGEISDSASVEEISEEDFNKQDVAKVTPKDSDFKDSKPKGGDNSRFWTMQDLYNYRGFRGYTSGLYNLAWAQAVQNKPLNDIFVMEVDPEEKRSSSSPSVNSSRDENNNLKEVEKVVIDDSGDEMDTTEKEEGELEEGEIDLDSEPANKAEAAQEEAKGLALTFDGVNFVDLDADLGNKELEKRLNSIREALGSVSVIDAEKSFEEVCSQLQKTLEDSRGVILEIGLPAKHSLIQLLYAAIQAVNSVFCSMNQNEKEMKKDTLSRLLSSVKSRHSHLLSPERMKEIEVMISSLGLLNVLPTTKASDKEKEVQKINGFQDKDPDSIGENANHKLTSSAKLPSGSLPAASVVQSHMVTLPNPLKTGMYGIKNRGTLLPLLDLHKDHDEDSLPSPTREAPTCFPIHKTFAAGDGIVKLGLNAAKMELGKEDSRIHHYETDALKAVSTYQQKFGRSTLSANDRLPSPTPSEEFDNDDADTNGEVSSSFTVGNSRTVSTPILGRPVFSSSTPVNSSIMQTPITAKNASPVSSVSTPSMKVSAKSRDPRLRFANSDLGALDLSKKTLPMVHNAPKSAPIESVSSRKQRTVDESNLDGPALKRQRKVLEKSGGGGWLEDNVTVGSQLNDKNTFVENAEVDPRKTISVVSSPTDSRSVGNEQVCAASTSAAASLPALLKDIAVNPTMLLNILKLGQQQRLASEAQPKSADPAKNAMFPPTSVVGAASLLSNASTTASGILQTSAGSPAIASQIASMSPQDELNKIRMKPRDPRRILHGPLQKSGSMGHEQFKNIVPPTSSTQGNKDSMNGQKQESQSDKSSVLSQSLAPPDIARQFTKNLKNIADLISVSNASTNPAAVSQIPSAEPVPVKTKGGDVKAIVSISEEQQSGTISTPEAAVASLPSTSDAWGDVEHLFEGYDDHQKAAIQRERARRIEEQKKMFSARKLCLVLDLDHTLLNSAKFVEVDSVHDEILRKKEEQDRELPQRHLFRLPHMGMWTKLRPGIWNFLDKASKLYELHLYTMGNKLYATEMAKLLDPTGALFSGRVISKGDDGDLNGDERIPKTKDLEGVLGMESAVVIIDDSVKVWPHNKLNLIVVERYIYFPCSRRQFSLPGPSLLELDFDERAEDGSLASSLAVIERIHQNFFSNHSLDEIDVRNILASEQRKILAGCCILFSRVFPQSEANPHLNHYWQTAEQFGAVCTNKIDEQVTHVVAFVLGTDKVNWALSTGRFVVHPDWLEASALLYRRANEQNFAIKPSGP